MLPDNPSKYLMGVCDQYMATEGFFDMMGFRLIEGKAPSKPKDVAVSQSFVKEMNSLCPTGAMAQWGRIS
jgi:hypothetical protein